MGTERGGGVVWFVIEGDRRANTANVGTYIVGVELLLLLLSVEPVPLIRHNEVLLRERRREHFAPESFEPDLPLRVGDGGAGGVLSPRKLVCP